MELVEVGNPFLHRHHMAQELALLPDGLEIVEGSHVDRQLDRCRAAAPDITVAGSASPTRSRRRVLATKWSIELLFHPHSTAYDQAADLSGLFARPLVRREKLKGLRRMKLSTVWTYEAPPHVGAMRVATAMEGVPLRPPRPPGRHPTPTCSSP